MPATQENRLQRISNELWEHALDAVRNQDYDGALRYVNEDLQIEPSNSNYISLKSEIYLYKGQGGKAVEFLSTSIAKYPSLTDLHLELAIALYNTDKFDESLSELSKCQGKLEKDPDVHYFRGLNLIKLGKIEDAKTEFNKALSLDSTLAKPHFALYTVYSSEGNSQKAMKELDLAIRFNPDNFNYRLEKIEKLKETFDRDQEYQELLKLVKACPNDTDAYVYSSEELQSIGAVRDAMTVATEGSVKWPSESKFPEVLSDVFMRLGYVDNAMKQIEKALEIKPHDSSLITKKLNIMIFKKDYVAALALLDKELETEPESKNFQLLKAQVLSYDDKKEEARGILNGLIDSGGEDALLLDSMLKAVQNINEKSGYNDIILKLCNKILEKDKKRSDVLSIKISTMINEGLYSEAEKDTRQVIAEKGENAAEFRDYLIDSLILEEKIDEAKLEMQNIKEEDYNAYNILQDSVLKFMQNDPQSAKLRLDDITKKYSKEVTCYTVKWFENIIGNKKLDFLSDMHSYACGDEQADAAVKTE